MKKNKNNSNNKKPNLPLTTYHSPLIYGISPVLEALNAGSRKIEKILVSQGTQHNRINEILDLARQQNIKFQKVPRSNFSSFVEPNTNHQGVIAFTSSANYYDSDKLFAEITEKEDSLCVILDGVEDPHNLGAILRSVECVGADGVFIPERRAVGLTETVTKTSAGASEYVKVAKVTNVNRLIDDLKQKNVWIVGASGDAEMNYSDWDWKQKTALVMGGEGKGLSRLTAEKCDVLVKIPMSGKIESLNVSVAAGVILFEASRQRNKAAGKK
ncbi:MAG: 23S rRNA (guanosine(2251)-2'-O)-methyltransferase RlmB [Acidobacteriota bacterium]|nr:23S rRNA (guanosine(2251)-2'-O)-methyltransferase RlmB [Acidobacteriota bacterium]